MMKKKEEGKVSFMKKKGYTFIDDKGSFKIENPQNYSYLYFPIANEAGMKSALTPVLGGDAKSGQNSFLLQPVSAEELHNNKSTRNFWCKVKGKGVVSLTGAGAQDEASRFVQKEEAITTLEAGLMWHKLSHKMPRYGLESEIVSFSPIGEHQVELMVVTVTNVSQEIVELEPIAAIPLFARSADNIRDHRHVTSLLHRIYTTEEGVVVNPTLTFDERGHKKNKLQYFVLGAEKPIGFYPVIEDFIGEGGSLQMPGALYDEQEPIKAGSRIDGYEALGGLVFAPRCLQAGEKASWIVILGMQEQEEVTADEIWMKDLQKLYATYDSLEKVELLYQQTKEYWIKRTNVAYHSQDKQFDAFMYWVSFQPMLRRIYGCSFLPHHDYGKGGRGWRDLWQDCLALLMMNPDGVRQMLVDNFGGVRIDGSNATIIGTKQGEFVADRNHITRVWMDHGLWPLMTTDFYIQQTGDIDILLELAPYFKDAQVSRGTGKDTQWDASQGCWQMDIQENVTRGTVLEHLLVQHLTAFYEVGEHNHMRLRGADWNDALDMATQRGESVAFSAAYAGNFKTLAKLLQALQQYKGIETIQVLPELVILLEKSLTLYEDIAAKKQKLDMYCESCKHVVNDQRIEIGIQNVIEILTAMSDWIMEHIRKKEWLQVEKHGWFNSYYDEHGNVVEGSFPSGIRMMLTGQVFTIMSETATKEQTQQIVKAADAYLYEADKGGYKLNTDFKEVKDDLGRMFGFAYGHKENGAVFSHMTTMYANALYQRGFVREGYKALHTLFQQAVDFEHSKIYPGIPEYFNDRGRGMYHYLTGAASWYMMTVITQMYGVRGYMGDLLLEPKLLLEQFDEQKKASVALTFAGKQFEVVYCNPQQMEYDAYRITEMTVDGQKVIAMSGEESLQKSVMLSKEILQQLDSKKVHRIEVVLGN